jgi:transposase
LNHRKFQRLNVSRADLFTEIDKPALQALPAEPFRFEQIKMARVNIDYHVDVDGHYYSVPYQLVSESVEVRIGPTTVEILHRGQRVAAHRRSFLRGKFSTLDEHRPKNHQAILQWTPERIRSWGRTFGPSTAGVIEAIIASRPYPEQAYRSCLGVLRLGDRFGKERLEAACQRALQLELCSFRRIRSMLEKGLDRQSSQPEPESATHRQLHANVRGAAYYQGKEAAHAAGTNH